MKKLAVLALVLVAASLSGCTALGIPYQSEACMIVEWAQAACDAKDTGAPAPVPSPAVEEQLREGIQAAQMAREARAPK